MFIQIRLNKDIQAYNEGAPKRGPLEIPMRVETSNRYVTAVTTSRSAPPSNISYEHVL